jgi:hypothetical protein
LRISGAEELWHETASGAKGDRVKPVELQVCGYASNARLVLGQLSVPEKTNEITAIPSCSTTSPKPVSSKERW